MPGSATVRERVIRRYGNRKLYDPQARRYVTLEGLARLVGQGQEVRVLDQRTGEDLTATVLAQVILEGVRERTARIPRQVLSRIVRLGAQGVSWTGDGVAEVAARGRREAERIAGKLLGRLSLDEAVALRQEIAGAVQRAAAEVQHAVEGRTRALLDRLERERALRPYVAALRERLLAAEARPAATRRRPPGKRKKKPPSRRTAARRRS